MKNESGREAMRHIGGTNKLLVSKVKKDTQKRGMSDEMIFQIDEIPQDAQVQ